MIAEAVDEVIRKYCVLPDEDAYVSVVLWVLHTHCIEAFETTPRLAVISPDKQCGKTRLLEVLGLLCKDSKNTADISPAALFRLIERDRPTLLLDEADTVFNKKHADSTEDLRRLLNSGYRISGSVIRCENFGRSIAEYSTFSAAALASIGDLPDTVMDRAVVIRMRRRSVTEVVLPFRIGTVTAEVSELYERLVEWGGEHYPLLQEAPELPPGLEDRPADVWEPLIAVADCLGGDWPKLARSAALRMTDSQQEEDGSIGIQILLGIKKFFEDTSQDKVWTEDLLTFLNSLETAKWVKWNFGQGLDSHDLAKYLKKYGVKSTQIKNEGKNRQGYKTAMFTDVFERYTRDREVA